MFLKNPLWWIVLAMAATVPGIGLRILGLHVAPHLAAFLFGVAIVGAAFLVAWAAETTEHAYKKAIVLVFVALIAVLPEYGVDMAFTWKAGQNFAEYGEFPVANMTGANRLLVGFVWPLLLLVLWFKTSATHITLPRTRALEIGVLAFATLYGFVVFIKGTLALYDFAVYGVLFCVYVACSLRVPTREASEPIGPVAAIVRFSTPLKRVVVVGMFVWAIAAIIPPFGVAEPFAESLVYSGTSFGIDEFLLVQWVAPFASEAPEALIATLFVLHMRPAKGLGVLVSSETNQLTLLVGMIPLVYAFSASVAQGHLTFDAFSLSDRQGQEILLTAAQSLFAVTLLVGFRFTWYEALLLFALFAGQFAFTSGDMRYGFSAVYLVLAGITLCVQHTHVVDFCRAFWNTVRHPGQIE